MRWLKSGFAKILFYRLAVVLLNVPALRDRRDDIGVLIDHQLDAVNRESESVSGGDRKRLSAGARKFMVQYRWRGNIRELFSTIRRAVSWSAGATITEKDVKEALLPVCDDSKTDILNRPLGDGFSLKELNREVNAHYLARALDEAGGE